MMKPDIAGEPLQDRRQAQIGRTLQGRGGRIPRVVTGPSRRFATVLHREQPDADDRRENQNRAIARRPRARSQAQPRPRQPRVATIASVVRCTMRRSRRQDFWHVERQAVEQDEDQGRQQDVGDERMPQPCGTANARPGSMPGIRRRSGRRNRYRRRFGDGPDRSRRHGDPRAAGARTQRASASAGCTRTRRSRLHGACGRTPDGRNHAG